MREIVTVTGNIRAEDLGFCQCHEHVALSRGKSFEVHPDLCMDDYDKSLEEVKRYRQAGGNSLVEAQPTGCSRVASWLHDMSRESGVNILASTGFHKMIFYPEDHWIHTIPQEELADLYVKELTEGMFLDGDAALPKEQSTFRAGLVKTAFDTEGLTMRYIRLFRAAAEAVKKTDRVLMIHVENGTDPVPLLEFLLNEGVKPSQMMFCHMDRACADLSLHRAILRTGAYLEYDTIGRFKYHDDAYEINLILRLLEEGFGRQLLYSLDTTRARLIAYKQDAVGLDYILRTFNGLLIEAGVRESTIEDFSVNNPRRLFSGEAD